MSAKGAVGSERLDNLVEMFLGASHREHIVDAVRHDRLHLLRDRPAMIDHMVSAHLE